MHRLAFALLVSGSCTSALVAAPPYADHQNLLDYLDAAGQKQAVRTIKDWQIRRQHILEHMQEVMGPLPGQDTRVPLEVQVLEEKQVKGLVRRLVSYRTEPAGKVQAYLFLPAKRGQRRPAVLCLQQTTSHGKAEPAGLAGDPSMHYALELAERGFVTLAPDYPSFGAHKWDFNGKHGYVSGTMKAIWDNIRAVDFLQSLAEVDGERIGVLGHSLGGHNAMFTAAFEPRLKVIVSSCGFTRFHKDDVPSWTGPRYMPRIATVYKNDADRIPFDFPEIVAAFAPRPFLACAAVKDADFDVSGVRDCLAAARPIYALHGKEAALEAYYPATAHAFPADARQKAYEFLSKHLAQASR